MREATVTLDAGADEFCVYEHRIAVRRPKCFAAYADIVRFGEEHPPNCHINRPAPGCDFEAA
jgi:hypothetical protein